MNLNIFSKSGRICQNLIRALDYFPRYSKKNPSRFTFVSSIKMLLILMYWNFDFVYNSIFCCNSLNEFDFLLHDKFDWFFNIILFIDLFTCMQKSYKNIKATKGNVGQNLNFSKWAIQNVWNRRFDSWNESRDLHTFVIPGFSI